ncbi:helix-turn-helix domain-containing protein [Viridibacillus arvi]|uniref:helix-turn-helix domain-containing protein n=1 Tax=Viridibacillus arvi TaxID=263475 RepID=UPI0034CFC075
MNYLQLGRLIRKLRTENNITMIDFAKRINISQPSLSRIENGNQEVNFTLLEKICKEFEISISSFFRCIEDNKEMQIFEENDNISRDIEQELDNELTKMLSTLSKEQKKGLYVLLLPYVKD